MNSQFDVEQVLWRRMAVFASGGMQVALEAICTDDGLALESMSELLLHLVEHSAVLVEHHGEETRYRVPTALQQSAWQSLVASGEADRLRQRHAVYYLALGTDVGRSVFASPQRVALLHQLEREHDNLQAALEWLAEHGEVIPALQLVGALRYFWVEGGHLQEGSYWLNRLLILPQVSEPTEMRAVALDHTGALAFVAADYNAARRYFEESLAIRRELGDPLPIAQSLLHLAAVVRNGDGDNATRRTLLEESLALARAAGHTFLTAVAVINLGTLELERGELKEADSLLREGAALYQSLHQVATFPDLLDNFAALAAAQGQAQLALRLAGAAATHREQLSIAEVPAITAWRDRYRVMARQALSQDERDAAWAEGQAMTLEEALAYALDTTAPARPKVR